MIQPSKQIAYECKIYPMRSKRIRKDNTTYTYTNYKTSFIPQKIIQATQMDKEVFVYSFEGNTYLTTTQPDQTVPFKMLNVQTLKRSKYVKWFTITRKFFPEVSQNSKILFKVCLDKQDIFSKKPAVIMQLI